MSRSVKEIWPDPPYGVGHAEEIQFLFPFSNNKFPYISLDSKDATFSQRMIEIWTRFANGDGDSGQFPLLLGGNEEETWKQINGLDSYNIGDNKLWLQLDNEPKMIQIAKDRMKFWDDFPVDELYFGKVSYS